MYECFSIKRRVLCISSRRNKTTNRRNDLYQMAAGEVIKLENHFMYKSVPVSVKCVFPALNIMKRNFRTQTKTFPRSSFLSFFK